MKPEVRQYATARAFAQALDHRLRSRSQEGGGDLARWRRLVTFDRFLARLFHGPEHAPWVVKGGYGLEVRYGMEARTTKDIDLSLAHRERNSREPPLDPVALQEQLQAAAEANLDDFFSFAVGRANEDLRGAPGGGFGFPLVAYLDERAYMSFSVDIVVGEPLVAEPEWHSGEDLLAFAGIPPARFRTVSIQQHFAEKVHAYVRPRASASTRVKDLVDLVLIAERGLPPATAVRHAVKGVFGAHPTSEVPQVFPGPPARWAIPYSDLTRTVGVRAKTLEEANARLSEVWLALGLASESTEG
jgi:hypothetical protein